MTPLGINSSEPSTNVKGLSNQLWSTISAASAEYFLAKDSTVSPFLIVTTTPSLGGISKV